MPTARAWHPGRPGQARWRTPPRARPRAAASAAPGRATTASR
nr:MAG TPA: hypothetical protein [Caudoviricetes sp.]